MIHTTSLTSSAFGGPSSPLPVRTSYALAPSLVITKAKWCLSSPNSDLYHEAESGGNSSLMRSILFQEDEMVEEEEEVDIDKEVERITRLQKEEKERKEREGK